MFSDRKTFTSIDRDDSEFDPFSGYADNYKTFSVNDFDSS